MRSKVNIRSENQKTAGKGGFRKFFCYIAGLLRPAAAGLAMTNLVRISARLHKVRIFRIIILFRVHFLHALGASFDSFAGRQFNPLEIGIFSLFGGGIVFAAQFHKNCVES
ncbi:MAG: hypothetical protein UV34_C0032G0009 [Parcubacteria group bacterium GW2011_GWB1_42_6]|nr:MAG: hypothetical protein UV34_C0032G0009 [Parcubacteria group bacterium GW2011_GWB1_42_6]